MELTAGWAMNFAQEYLFDYLLYPLVIHWLGLLWGGVLMAFASLVFCLLLLRAYDWSQRDWLGIEAVKGLKDYAGPSRWRRLSAWLLQRGDGCACVVLAIKFDPFVTTIYLRHGQFNGLSRRDWRIFFASWVIANVYWTLVCFGGLSAFRWVREVFWP